MLAQGLNYNLKLRSTLPFHQLRGNNTVGSEWTSRIIPPRMLSLQQHAHSPRQASDLRERPPPEEAPRSLPQLTGNLFYARPEFWVVLLPGRCPGSAWGRAVLLERNLELASIAVDQL